MPLKGVSKVTVESAQAVAQRCVQESLLSDAAFLPCLALSAVQSAKGQSTEGRVENPFCGSELALCLRCLAPLSCLLGVTAGGGSGP